MLSRTLNQIQESPWGKLVWAFVGVLVVLQMVAFYRLCTSQVARAHARETIAVEQRDALTDCLDYLAKSTISSCVRSAATDREAGSLESRDLPSVTSSKQAVFSTAVPVSFVFH
jgi:hypothetical protein